MTLNLLVFWFESPCPPKTKDTIEIHADVNVFINLKAKVNATT
jgi:hypothetical protein